MSIDLSLTRLEQLLPHLPYTRPTLHIAGTNGKGSVSALLTSILLSSTPPLRVGRFNSPHLTTVLDSITINNLNVDRDVYQCARKQVEAIDRREGTKLTGFELLTMTALCVFEGAGGAEKVDIVVLEVGLGGRLDATNIVPSEYILASALTAVDLDHQAFLGNTVALIAREKAAIARKGKPFILGNQLHQDVKSAAQQVVTNLGGDMAYSTEVKTRDWDEKIDGKANNPVSLFPITDLESSTNFSPSPQPIVFSLLSFPSPIHALLPLNGAHQLDNLGTALGVINALLTHPTSLEASEKASLDLQSRINPQSIAAGIRNAKWAGRLSFHTISVPVTGASKKRLLVLADGAHNPASAKTLGAYIAHLLNSYASSKTGNVDTSITYILSLSHSPPKTPLQTLTPIFSPLSPLVSSVKVNTSVALLRFTPPESMPWVKSVPPSDMRETVKTLIPDIADSSVWAAPDVALEAGPGSGSSNVHLEEAFKWAAEKHPDGLVVLAGSLYLVADFYRLLENGF